MNYIQDDDGNVLTVPTDVFLVKGIVRFDDFAIRGERSTEFTAPNDSETRTILGYYGINQINKLIQKPFHFYIDGNRVSDGRVFINSVGNTFSMHFIGGNGNWMNLITGSIKDLDLSDFDVVFTAANVVSRMSATEGIIFPVIDWAYNYKKLSNCFSVSQITGVRADGFYDFYPCFYVHTILEKLFDDYGIKLSGNLVNDPVFKTMAITPNEIQSLLYTSQFNVNAVQKMSAESGGDFGIVSPMAKINMLSGTSYFNNSTDRLTFPNTLGLQTVLYFYQRANTGSVFQTTVSLRKNGVEISTFNFSSPDNLGSGSVQTYITAGDYLELWVENGYLIVDTYVSVSFVDTVLKDNTVYSSNILPDISQIDFVKYIAQRFNCLIDYNDINQTITFTKLDSLHKKEAVDYSDKIVDFALVPPSGFSERNYIRTTEAAELVTYKSEDLNFGDMVVASDGDGEQDVFKTPMRPAETFTNFNLDWLITSIPLISLEDADEGIAYTSVTNSSGNAVFNGTGFTFVNDSIVRVSGDYAGFFSISTQSATVVTPNAVVDYKGAGTGKIYKQKIVFNNAGSREVIIIPSTNIQDIIVAPQIYSGETIRIKDSLGTTGYTSAAWAYFCKPNIGTNLDDYKVGLNYGPVVNVNSLAWGDLYFNNFNKIITGSRAKATFLLSQTEYYNLDLANFIFLRTKEFAGYFLITRVDGYANQFTPVEMDLVLMD